MARSSKQLRSPDTTSKPDYGLFVGIFFGVVGIVFFALQADGVDMSWQFSVFVYLACAVALAWTTLRHAVPSQKRTTKYGLMAAMFLTVTLLGAIGTTKEYRKEHSPDKQVEVLQEIKFLDKQQKFLEEFPLGYTIFDVNSVSGAVDPLEARQGLEAYEFDFRDVKILENTPEGFAIQLPSITKNGKYLLTNPRIGGDRASMLTYGSGYTFGDQSKIVLATGIVLSANKDRIVWIFGMRQIFLPHK
jgi:hypothetical protein